MKLIDTMENYLTHQSFKYVRAEDKDKVILFFPNTDHRVCVEVFANEDRRSISVKADAGVMIPAGKRLAAAEFVTRANYGMIIGGFQMDMSDGEIFFRTGLIAEDEVSPKMMEPLLQAAASTYSRYHAGLMAILYQEMAAGDAIALVEGEGDGDVSAEQIEEGFTRLLCDLEEPSLTPDETLDEE